MLRRLALAIASLTFAAAAGAPQRNAALAAPWSPFTVDQRPLVFEPADSPAGAAWIARGSGYHLTVSAGSVELRTALGPDTGMRTVRLDFRGAHETRQAVATPASGVANYIVGGDPHQWKVSQPVFERVRFNDVYPGVAVEYYGNQRRLEYDFIVAPGASAEQIALGCADATDVSLDDEGNARLSIEGGFLRLHAPIAYQDTPKGRQHVLIQYAARDPLELVFEVGAYDRRLPLVIDPVLTFATNLGGLGDDDATGVAVDASGNVYVSGTTLSPNYPVAAPGVGAGGGRGDVFVTKLNPLGAVVFSTFLGGALTDQARGVAVDAAGNVYVAGTTASTNFPVVNAMQPSNAGGLDGFVLKLNASGAGLAFSSYLGGSEIDEVNGIALDGAGSAYLTGTTFSSNFPVLGPRQAGLAGGTDAFLAKFTSWGGLAFATFHGGGANDQGRAVAVDASGAAIVTGTTMSSNFPVVSALQATRRGGVDAFVSRFTSAGTALVYSTYFGGSDVDAGDAIVVDSTGTAFIAGSTLSADFPVLNGNLTQAGSFDAFLAVITPGGLLSASTFFGGSGSERTRALARDAQGRLYLVGQTSSANLPAVGGPAQAAFGGGRDVFAALFGYTGSALQLGWSTYYGGGNDEDAQAVAVDRAGRVWIAGALGYSGVGARGGSDAFLVRLTNGDFAEDTDGDGMPNEWESQFNLNPLTNDAAADPDGDGRTNLQEFQQGTHPNGRFTRYLAEGATGTFFVDTMATANPNPQPATVLFRFQRSDGTVVPKVMQLAPLARATLDAASVPGLAAAEFSTVIESDQAVVVDRTMSWNTTAYYGSHAETSIAQPSTIWYLAEGATHSAFDLFYLIQNPGTSAATVEVTYLLPPRNGVPQVPIVRTYTVGPQTRFNIWVDRETPALAATDVSAKIVSTNNVPILVERAMYMRAGGQTFGAGHASAGVTAPATSWFLAEGATGSYFDLFVLIANPSSQDAQVRATYLLPNGSSVVRSYTVGRQSRFNIWVDNDDPRLADTAVSTIVESTNGVPIIVERAMWWPGPTSASWLEAHNSPGSTVTGTKWALAEGERGGPRATQTYVLVANTSSFTGTVKVTLQFEDDGSSAERTYAIAGRSRYNVAIDSEFPEATGRRFWTLVESLGTTPAQLVVERAMYSNSGSTVWAAGTNALATRLSP